MSVSEEIRKASGLAGELVRRERTLPPMLAGSSTPALEAKVERFYRGVAEIFETWVARVATALRYSLFESPTPVPVRETYTYGSHGLVTERDTLAYGLYNLHQKWTYNSLALVETMKYPRCNNAGIPQANCNTHGDLDDVMELGDAGLTRHEQPPPDHRADAHQMDLELIDQLAGASSLCNH